MNKKFVCAGLGLALGAGYALTAYSQAKPEVLVKQRQSAMQLQAKYFGPLAGMAQGKIPWDPKIVARNVGYLEVLTLMAWDGFAPSTKDEKSGALPAVFSDTAKFKEAENRLHGAIDQLAAAAKGGDEAAIKAAIGGVGKACGGCHDDFREKR